MNSMHGFIGENLTSVLPVLLGLILLLIGYLVLMVRAIIQMLKYKAHSVLLTFAFLSLIPFPLIVIMGVMILIIWHYHKKDIVRE